jgi:hypothetical protein
MASIVVGNRPDPRVIYRTQYTSVWVKPYYGDSWRYAAYLFPESSTEAAAPSDSEATLSWDYGKYVNLWGDPGATLLPLNINNWHVAILVHTIYGTYISWIGIAVGESLTETGIDVETGLPRGEQIIECRGLEYLLERRNVVGTYVGDAVNWVNIMTTRNFNSSNSRRESLAGNRSAAINQDSGSYLFSSDGNKWSNLDIINYLLSAFQPWMAYQSYGSVTYGPQFYIVGQTEALEYIFEEHRLGGRSVRECLNQLIDRKRGLGWKIMTDGVGPIYIYVYSISQYWISGNNAYLPANPIQYNVPIHDDRWIQARYRISSMNQVDRIVVESECPIRCCATLRFSDGTLEPAWAPQLDAEQEVDSEEYNYFLLAEYLYENFATADIYPDGFLTYYEFDQFRQVDNTLFLFLNLDEFGLTRSELLIGYNKLDADGDGRISKPDLLTFVERETYQTSTEEERATDKYAAVFSEFQVPREWGWEGWAPFVYFNGQVDINRLGYYWNHDIEMHRYLPFVVLGNPLATEKEYMEPFGFIEDPYEPRSMLVALANDGAETYTLEQAQAVYPGTTARTFNLFAVDDILYIEDIYAGLEDNPATYIQLDRAQQLDKPSCSLRMGDSGMKIIVKSEANHVFALNHEEGGSFEKAPVFDYETLQATVFFDTDMTPRCMIPVWINTYRDQMGNITGQSSPTGKEIYIQVPGKEVWIVAPNTVTGLTGTDLDFYNEGFGGVVRDDTDDLRFIAMLAYVWYGQQRASVDFTIQNQLSFFQIGDLIRSTLSGWTFERIGTCVTSITRNYQDGTHSVSTGYGELDPVSFGDKSGGMK